MITEYISGVVGGIAVVLVGHPFDTTKTRLQTAPVGFYSSTLDCLKKTVRREGFAGFYSGILSPLGGQMFFRAASFTSYKYFAHLFQNNGDRDSNNNNNIARYFFAGAATGAVISFIETPIDLIKTKLQVQIFSSQFDSSYKPAYSNVRGCIRHIYLQHGLKGLWQGWLATAVRNIPANAMFFPVNEVMKIHIAGRKGCEVSNLQLQDRLIAGASAGFCYWVGTYPLDLIKGQIQAASFASKPSWLQAATMIYKANGLLGFTKGLAPCAARSIPACSALFATVDVMRDLLNRDSPTGHHKVLL